MAAILSMGSWVDVIFDTERPFTTFPPTWLTYSLEIKTLNISNESEITWQTLTLKQSPICNDMSARRTKIISGCEIQFKHKPAKNPIDQNKRVSQNAQTLNRTVIYSYCVLNRLEFKLSQILLHRKLTLWSSFLYDDGWFDKNDTVPG